MARLSHLAKDGTPAMVDVGGKKQTLRRAVVEALLKLKPAHTAALEDNPKGNVLVTAQIAGIQAGKRCAELIPLCHTVPLNFLDVTITGEAAGLRIVATAEAEGVTGVEMEAYVAAAIAGVTLIDMLKGVDPDLALGKLRLMEKTGGKTPFKR
ncbi:MAG TPA: cyclic pyranopterin monophosphate synthase MoaC [Fimbriimonadaceae bacterium]|nr:cyclic pyranopterin monophosphate synthase MoaC [Fimbriimonadaceae bacterium]